jgi:hypothetical protein
LPTSAVGRDSFLDLPMAAFIHAGLASIFAFCINLLIMHPFGVRRQSRRVPLCRLKKKEENLIEQRRATDFRGFTGK